MAHAQSKILIHVGLPKTGTTSLQVALKSTEGVDYIHDPSDVLPQSRRFSNAVGVGRDVLAEADRADERQSFILSARNADLPVVVSDETLSQISRIDWKAFEDMLSALNTEIRIVLVLRPFFSWMESLFNQFAKRGRLGILVFDPEIDNRLNAYDINFEAIYIAYCNFAEKVGPNCQVQVIRYSSQVNVEIFSLIGISSDYLHTVPPLNPSPSARESMLMFLKLNGLNAPSVLPVPETLRFLGHKDIDLLHRLHSPWMTRLATQLEWPLEAIDDYETFRESASSASLLDIARDLVPETQLLYYYHEKDADMAENTSAGNRKIKGDLARALLRMELKTGREGTLSEEEFKAAWTARKDEMIEKAGLIRQILSRMGYDLVERPTEDTASEA